MNGSQFSRGCALFGPRRGVSERVAEQQDLRVAIFSPCFPAKLTAQFGYTTSTADSTGPGSTSFIPGRSGGCPSNVSSFVSRDVLQQTLADIPKFIEWGIKVDGTAEPGAAGAIRGGFLSAIDRLSPNEICGLGMHLWPRQADIFTRVIEIDQMVTGAAFFQDAPLSVVMARVVEVHEAGRRQSPGAGADRPQPRVTLALARRRRTFAF